MCVPEEQSQRLASFSESVCSQNQTKVPNEYSHIQQGLNQKNETFE